jgi:hypothetical protein
MKYFHVIKLVRKRSVSDVQYQKLSHSLATPMSADTALNLRGSAMKEVTPHKIFPCFNYMSTK